ncbi:MAG: hypothetical protein JWM64_58 [Frankiales bacterium]|nr:hypothetical protein [Frankiales bacterium]
MQRLVVCADGTWRSEDDPEDRTNVEKLRDAVVDVASDGARQPVHYQSGVGTGRRLDHWIGGAFGAGLSRNVQACYRWLVEHYGGPDSGDQLYLFGFSRGAFTVRSLAGLIRNVGLLQPARADMVEEAYAHYRDPAQVWRPDGVRALAFREQFSRDVPHIRCIGVWDTVGSLGIPTVGPLGLLSRRWYGFHDVELSGRVEHAFHALGIDERRRAFRPTLWEADDAHANEQEVEQTWFAGAHSDVGGGYKDCGLSDTTLLWMAERAQRCGLELDLPALRPAVCAADDGRMHDSLSSFFRLQGTYERPLGAPPVVRDGRTLRTHETVYPGVLRRRELCKEPPQGPYEPTNLLTHLARTAPPA